MYYVLDNSYMSATKLDDLDAVRTVVDAIKDFNAEEQQRILRWVIEKLKLPQPFAASVHTVPSSGTVPPATLHPVSPTPGHAIDIKTFISEKKPRNDVQFAATVAYYYRFEAPLAERKDVINKEDLQDATRKAGRERFAHPLMTLNNAHTLGLLDRGAEKGTYSINSVGENLVAMTLPDGTAAAKPGKKKGAKPAAKRAVAKKVTRARAKKA
jgi:hypothetical protein